MAVAVPPSGADPGLPWFATLAEEELTTSIKRSDDYGYTFNGVHTEAMVDRLRDGTYTDDGVAAFLATEAGRYWYTLDGDSWISADLSFAIEDGISPMAGGQHLYFVSGTEVWAVDPGEEPVIELSGPRFGSVHEGEAGPVAITATDGAWWRNAGTWEELGEIPTAHAWSATSTDDGVFIGASDGKMYRWTGASWTRCGQVSWLTESAGHEGIVRMGGTAGALLATRAGKGAAVSNDQCATWTPIDPPMEIDFEDGTTYGSSTPDDEAFQWLSELDGAYVVAGYDGFTVTPDGGATWYAPTLLAPDFARGFAFSNRFRYDGKMLIASHGGSVYRTADAGLTFDAPGVGALQSFCQQVRIDPRARDTEVAYSLHNRSFHRSTDGGATWTELDAPFSRAREIDVGVSGRVWASGTDSAAALPAGVVYSDDGGDSWNLVDFLPSSFDEVPVERVVDRGTTICVMSPDEVACSTDSGATFSVLRTRGSDEGQFRALEAYPARGAVRSLFLATDDGIYRSSPTTAFTQKYSGYGARHIVVADNGHILAGDVAGRVLRSTDIGSTWTDLGVGLPAQIASLVPRPDFATFPQVFVGTMDGTYVVSEGSMERFGSYQRVDSFTKYAVCDECTSNEVTEASVHDVAEVPEGATYTIYMRGTHIRFVGRALRGADVQVRVDGTLLLNTGVGHVSLGDELASVDVAEDGWHRVEFTVVRGSGVAIDAVESTGEGVSITRGRLPRGGAMARLARESEDGEAASCATAPGAGWMGALLGLAALVRRRQSAARG